MHKLQKMEDKRTCEVEYTTTYKFSFVQHCLNRNVVHSQMDLVDVLLNCALVQLKTWRTLQEAEVNMLL